MHFHLVGIGGAGISAIARVLLGRGFVVSGSDQKLNELTAVLQTQGATIYEGHRAEQIDGADALVISSAVPAGNPEVDAALAAGLPVLKRADLLGQLMADTIGIAVAGSHGKTTTTGMIAQILLTAGLDPTVIVGGVLPVLGSNGRYGEGDYFVVEADEYDYMFLGLRPEVIVITSLEHDHPDIFPTEADYTAAFRQFAGLLPVDGRLIACADDPGTARFLETLNLDTVEITTYGLPEEEGGKLDVDFQALDCRPNQLGGTDFLVELDGQIVGLARLRVPGRHNVRNALAAIIVGLDLEIDFAVIRQALAEFGGVGRRFQVVGEIGGVTVIDDYAHHPTEIRATLAAARQRYPGRRLWAVWQPHTFSRTKLLLDEFAASFADADRVVALDIYHSRETDDLGISTAAVLTKMNPETAVHIPKREDAAAYILDRVRPDDVILTLGAGDGDMVGQWVLAGLKERLND
ncbi:MAG: UDP-N-acetylmuramate--L-alanine ligase [Ardenticatenaceae bacterium]|nr:UDP-N-acetylmuramate--L-alanine ligase [Ardenticatenaceae bacterium]MCB9442827.1 UDP-N-acetylmuramate--L-alanine ligase [Ardenticatenaceae bacterium]